MTKSDSRSSDVIAFQILAYEFPTDRPETSDRKIKAAFRRHEREPYDQRRVEMLRKLKDYLQQELGKGGQSEFFKGRLGQYAEAKDFDIEKLLAFVSHTYPDIEARDLYEIVWFAIYVNYLR